MLCNLATDNESFNKISCTESRKCVFVNFQCNFSQINVLSCDSTRFQFYFKGKAVHVSEHLTFLLTSAWTKRNLLKEINSQTIMDNQFRRYQRFSYNNNRVTTLLVHVSFQNRKRLGLYKLGNILFVFMNCSFSNLSFFEYH